MTFGFDGWIIHGLEVTLIASTNQLKVRERKAAKLSLFLEHRPLLPREDSLAASAMPNSYMNCELYLAWLVGRWHRKSGNNTNSQSETRVNRWHGLTSPPSIKRRRQGWADRGWVSPSTSLLLNHTDIFTHIFYLVLWRFMAWTETRRTLGQTTRRMLSGSKTFFHSTYLMLGLWHLDTMLMRHSEIPLQTL